MNMDTEYQRPPLKVALMGLGRSMFSEHYSVFKSHPALFRVVCACDVLKERRDIVERDFPECKIFRRLEDMLEERDIDLVDIATYSMDHVAHAMLSLKHGFWTLVESPVALNVNEAAVLRGQAQKAKNKIIVMQRGIFEPDFLLAQQVMQDKRLGNIYEVIIRSEDFVRRDDWQAVKRLGGGASYYAMTDLLIQAFKLMPSLPIQMWSDLKRVSSLGDAEDYVRVIFKTRELMTFDIGFNGGVLEQNRGYSYIIRGDRGEFKVRPGAREGIITMIEPKYKFPRRRSSVKQPPLEDMHEVPPTIDAVVSLPKGTMTGLSAFWRNVYATVRTANTFPITLEDSINAVKFAQLMKKTSSYK